MLPLSELLDGTKRMLLTLYDPRRFYERVLDSLERWQVQPEQKAPGAFFAVLVESAASNLFGGKACCRAIVGRIGTFWDGS